MSAHQLKIRVYYEDTDAGGVVYHASYLRYAERGRTELLRKAGFDHTQIINQMGVQFAVVAMNINYNAPAKLDDLLVLKTKITRVGGASMEMQQDVYKGSRLLTEMKVTLVCIDGKFKAVRVPAEIRKKFEKKL